MNLKRLPLVVSGISLLFILTVSQGCGRRKPDLASLGMKFVEIPAGSFLMGETSRSYPLISKGPVHQVILTRPFLLQTTEVTQAQWETVMGKNPSVYKGTNRPVEQVTWFEVQEFIRTLNELDPGKGYRLPTEAEWEYACRAGARGDGPTDLDAVAWCSENSGGITHPVGLKEHNAWGLYDMLGNVAEWCSDWNGDYPEEGVIDPQGPLSGESKVFRGGFFALRGETLRYAERKFWLPQASFPGGGFRLVRDIVPVNTR